MSFPSSASIEPLQYSTVTLTYMHVHITASLIDRVYIHDIMSIISCIYTLYAQERDYISDKYTYVVPFLCMHNPPQLFGCIMPLKIWGGAFERG